MTGSAWDEVEALHADTVARFLATARSIPTRPWTTAPAPGKWCPAEVTQHLVLTYAALARQQEEGLEIPLRIPRLRAWAAKTFVLPLLLRGRPFPPGVRAPREVRPASVLPERDALDAAFVQAADRFRDAYRAARERPGAGASHPFFGSMTLLDMHRFASIHTEHHRRQITWAAASPPAEAAPVP